MTAGEIRVGVDGPPATISLAWVEAREPVPDDAWLTARERALLAGLRVPKRAGDWRLGRWAAKEAVMRALGAPSLQRSEVEILPVEGGGPAVRILRADAWPPVAVSLSHSGGVGFAAASLAPVRLGCDVEEVAPRSEAFVTDYFTAAEASWIRSEPAGSHLRANLLWSAKESTLKALGEGLRADTRSVEIVVEELDGDAPAPDGWRSLRLVWADGPGPWIGRWRLARGLVWTVVSDSEPTLGLSRGLPGTP